MGQPIAVTSRRGVAHGTVRFELNRTLTGMGHERYAADRPVPGNRPPDELARRLFATGKVAAAHVYSNIVTVELQPGETDEGLADVIEYLYRYYPDVPEADAAPEPSA